MTALIIEDETPAATRLVRILREIDPGMQITGPLDTVERSIQYLQSNPQPDLIFLDIELGDGQSFDIFSRIEVRSHIIFITAFDEFALKAFKYNSIDYLLKPLKKADLQFALDKLRKQNTPVRQHFDFTQILQDLKPRTDSFKNRFLVKKGARLLSIATENIAFFYTKDKLHWMKTKDGADYIIENNLDELETLLDPEKFNRVNRQFILGYDSIETVYNWFNGKLKVTVRPEPFEDIVISRTKAGDFKKWMGAAID